MTSERILTNMANYRARMSDEQKAANKLAAKLRMRAKRARDKAAAALANPPPPPPPPQPAHDAIENPRSTKGQQLGDRNGKDFYRQQHLVAQCRPSNIVPLGEVPECRHTSLVFVGRRLLPSRQRQRPRRSAR